MLCCESGVVWLLLVELLVGEYVVVGVVRSLWCCLLVLTVWVL